MLLLDRVVEVTGYASKYAIRLLNHLPESATRIQRPRQPIYGSVVQDALFLAWRTIQYPCAKRLVPCLSKLIPVLERDGHLRLKEEHRAQLLAMSARTAERLLSTQRRPTPHGFSTTKPGTLLKHQIPICTFAQWDDDRPGFVEADLVAHCGSNVFGGYLYTLTLTDIATGWTECVPVLNRSPETVLAAIWGSYFAVLADEAKSLWSRKVHLTIMMTLDFIDAIKIYENSEGGVLIRQASITLPQQAAPQLS
ncbi:MAG TPA: hypothetical protein VFV38_35615 [Ktedonobacteraceae bacterium]|nr:hypothetical protein [Ktedonobacteraceae bacterium]